MMVETTEWDHTNNSAPVCWFHLFKAFEMQASSAPQTAFQ